GWKERGDEEGSGQGHRGYQEQDIPLDLIMAPSWKGTLAPDIDRPEKLFYTSKQLNFFLEPGMACVISLRVKKTVRLR
ncbi:MAG TPA: hypothetical protein VFK23_07445, partial [Nitrospirota bacterium]|nr:hypothetical protein [Nitrospirota bacterium]